MPFANSTGMEPSGVNVVILIRFSKYPLLQDNLCLANEILVYYNMVNTVVGFGVFQVKSLMQTPIGLQRNFS